MELLAKGKRGKVYLEGNYVVKRADETRIKNEVFWLKKLNNKGIGPKLISFGEDWFKAEYVEGKLIEDYLSECSKENAAKLLKDCLKQCRSMDRLKVNKKEMHHPVKHVIVVNDKPVFIDFERCKFTEKPKNVTQFCQYVLRLAGMFPEKIKVDKEEIKEAVMAYKREQSEKNFKRILMLL